MTEFDIRGLLDDYADNGIDIRAKNIVSVTQVKEDVMNRIEKTSPRRYKKLWPTLVAAVLCVALLTATAFAAGIFKLGERQVENAAAYTPTGEYVPAVSDAETFDTPDLPTVSAIGFVNSNEYLAAQEWEAYVESSVADGTNLLDANPENFQADGYTWVHAFSPEARDTLNAILEKYDLQLPTYEEDITHKDLYDMTGKTDALPPNGDRDENSPYGRYFEGGALQIVDQADIHDGLTVNYDLYRSVKGWFSRDVRIFTELDTIEEWEYTTLDGTAVTLERGLNQSVLMAELENSFLYVHIRSGSENTDPSRSSYSCPTVDKSDLEAFADSINFTVLDSIK